MSKTLTEKDFEIAAKILRCEIASVKAVAEIESLGKGFYADGFPVILFERHVFRKYTKGKYNQSHPHLSGPAGNYGAAGQNQRNKFNEAFALSPTAAMKACSWGKFQIMGFNHAVCGFATVGELVDAMKVSEGEQLLAFVKFVIGNNLADELRKKQWAAFAKGYNGAGYKKNNYDVKLAAAYRKYAAQKHKKSSTTVPAILPAKINEPVETSEPEILTDSFAVTPNTTDDSSINEQPSIQNAEAIVNVGESSAAAVNQPDEPFYQYLPRITKEKILFGFGIITTFFANCAAWYQDLPIVPKVVLGTVFVAVVIGFIWLVVTHRRQLGEMIREAMNLKADKTKNSPILTTDAVSDEDQTPFSRSF